MKARHTASATSPRNWSRAFVVVLEHHVRLTQRHVDHVVGVDRGRPVGDAHGAGEPQHVRQPDGVDGDHAVDGPRGGLGQQVVDHRRRRREVGRHVHVLPDALRFEALVPCSVVGGGPQRPGLVGARVEHAQSLEPVEVERAVRRGDDAPVPDEAALRTRFRVVLHREEVPAWAVAAEHRGEHPGRFGGDTAVVHGAS